MERFSDDLRQQREDRQISLERIAETTKISRRHLLALEAGEFDALPGGIFRKGILRGYLSALNMDPAPWLPRFEQCLAEFGQPAIAPVDLVQIAEGVERSRAPVTPVVTTRWPGVFVMLLLLLVFSWCIWRFALRGHLVLSAGIPPVPVFTP